MKIGIRASAIAPELPLEQAACRAREAGFEVLEAEMRDSGELTPSSDATAVAQLARQVHSVGMEVWSLVCERFWDWNYAAPDPLDRQRAYDLTVAMLDRARWLGARAAVVIPAVVAAPGERRGRVRYETALHAAAAALRQLAAQAELRGVYIAVRNTWNRFLLSPVEMREFIDQINSPWVGVCLDTGSLAPYGFAEDWIRTLEHRIIRVHVRDGRAAASGPDGLCSPGQGDVNWPEVVAALRETGYDGPLICAGPGDPAGMARMLRGLLA